MIIPTKDRPEYINTMVQNLVEQSRDFDLFIADMSTDPNLLRNNWFLNKALIRLQHTGHSWMVVRVEGHNQLFGYQAGLEFARGHGYELAVASDDDIIFGAGWLHDAKIDMRLHPECACLAGMTLLPWMSDEEQKCPDWYLNNREYKGGLDLCTYYHCTLIPPEGETDDGRWRQPRIEEFEQLFGPFMFRVDEFVKVGGFPMFLSPLGFRGEMWPMVASFFDGKKLLRDPDLRCWHYSAAHGGLKVFKNEERDKLMKADSALWEEFIRRHQPRVMDPRL